MKFAIVQSLIICAVLVFFTGCYCISGDAKTGTGSDYVYEMFVENNPDHSRYELNPTTVYQLERELQLQYDLSIFRDYRMLERFPDYQDVVAYLENRRANMEFAKSLAVEELEEIKDAMKPGDELFLFTYRRTDGVEQAGVLLLNEAGEIKIRSHLFE